MADVDVPLGPEDLRDHFVGARRIDAPSTSWLGTAARWRCCACARRPTGRCSRRSPTWRCSPGPTSRSRCSLPDRHRRPEQLARAAADMAPGASLRRRMRSLRARELHPRAVSDPTADRRGGAARAREARRSGGPRARSRRRPPGRREEVPTCAPWRSACRRTTTCSRVAGPSGSARGGRSSIAVPRARTVLVGCARSRQIHEHFYGDVPPTVETCPREPVGTVDGPTLTKCCLLEDGSSARARSSSSRGERARRGP